MEYFAPQSIEEAVAILSRYNGGARVLAGGTDLGLELRESPPGIACLVYIGKLPGICDIEIRDDRVRIGAAATYRAILGSAELRRQFPALSEAAENIGGPPIQNMGTLGGNIVTASPAGDGILPLLAFGAEVVLRGPNGERPLPLDEFFLGPRRTKIEQGELIAEIRWAVPAGRFASSFIKLGRRQAMAISIVAVATQIELDEAGRCRQARIALGAVAPTPLRARAAEAELVGQALTPELIERAGDIAGGEARPIDDLRASAWYRVETTKVLVRRSLDLSLARANGNGV